MPVCINPKGAGFLKVARVRGHSSRTSYHQEKNVFFYFLKVYWDKVKLGQEISDLQSPFFMENKPSEKVPAQCMFSHCTIRVKASNEKVIYA